jgi:hypothetical protein
VARANTVKKVWVRIAQSGKRKIAMTNLTQRVGIIHESAIGWRRTIGAATFTRRPRLRP